METANPVEYQYRYNYLGQELFDDNRRNVETIRRKTFNRLVDNEVVTHTSYSSLATMQRVAIRYGIVLEEIPVDHEMFKRQGPNVLACRRIPKEEVKKLTEVTFDPTKLAI